MDKHQTQVIIYQPEVHHYLEQWNNDTLLGQSHQKNNRREKIAPYPEAEPCESITSKRTHKQRDNG